MVLNHLDLQVSDVQAVALLFETHFGLALESSRKSPAIAILSDGHGFVLVLQRKADPEQAYPEGFHLGFLVGEVSEVLATHRRLSEAGMPVSPVERNNRGTMIYCRAPDGIVIEVSCRKQH